MRTAIVFVALVSIAACSGRTAGSGPPPSAVVAPGDDDDVGAPASGDDVASAPAPDDAAHADDGAVADAGDTSDAADADEAEPPGVGCTQPLGPGGLAIDELMIESVKGAGDDGEWLEVRSTVDCAVNLRGLHGSCPRGAKVAVFDVTEDTWLPAHGTFVVADSSDPAIDHQLPGLLFVWFGQPGDVLRNQGATVTLSLGAAIVDTLTYPSLALAVGVSLAFPSDCAPAERGDFGRWRRSTRPWFPSFFGTPNAPNDDVTCPVP